MDNFNYQAYLKSGKIYGEKATITESEQISEKKYKQGYDDREDESLGARRGAEKGKKQSFKDRRDDSYGKFGKRDAEAKGKDKGPGRNKVNKENVEETAPGFTHDCAAHVMHESHGYGLCLEGRHTLVETTEGHAEVTHYDVMFKNGNVVEKIPVNELKILTSEAHHHGKEEKDLEEVGKGYFKKKFGIGKKGFSMDKRKKLKETIIEIKAKMDEGSYPFDQCVADQEGQYGKEGAKRVCGSIRAAYGEGLVKENLSSAEKERVMDALNNYVVEFKPDFGKVSEIADMLSELTGISSNKIQSHLMQLTGGDDEMIFEDARTDAEEEGYEDGFKDAKKDMKDALSKMKVSELKAKIKEDIIEILSEQDEEVDVDVEDEVKADVDVDVEDDVAVDAQGDDINIKKKSVKADIEVGLSPVEELVQDSLEAAMKASEQLGNQTLTDQIGNTITYFTREFVVGRNTD